MQGDTSQLWNQLANLADSDYMYMALPTLPSAGTRTSPVKVPTRDPTRNPTIDPNMGYTESPTSFAADAAKTNLIKASMMDDKPQLVVPLYSTLSET